MPEQVVDGKAAIAVVRHQLCCPTLLGADPDALARPAALNAETIGDDEDPGRGGNGKPGVGRRF